MATQSTTGQWRMGRPGESAAIARDILSRIDALLSEAGTDKPKLFCNDMAVGYEHLNEMNEVWDGGSPRDTPARACGDQAGGTSVHGGNRSHRALD